MEHFQESTFQVLQIVVESRLQSAWAAGVVIKPAAKETRAMSRSVAFVSFIGAPFQRKSVRKVLRAEALERMQLYRGVIRVQPKKWQRHASAHSPVRVRENGFSRPLTTKQKALR